MQKNNSGLRKIKHGQSYISKILSYLVQKQQENLKVTAIQTSGLDLCSRDLQVDACGMQELETFL